MYQRECLDAQGYRVQGPETGFRISGVGCRVNQAGVFDAQGRELAAFVYQTGASWYRLHGIPGRASWYRLHGIPDRGFMV